MISHATDVVSGMSILSTFRDVTGFLRNQRKTGQKGRKTPHPT
jgi:hypothetical protein